MNKRFFAGLLAALCLIALAAAAQGETLFVDNRETDKLYPERLNLRASPAADGDLLGLFYSGAPVEPLGEEENGYIKVEIDGVIGYMAKEYLISKEEADKRYGADSDFFTGRAAQVDLIGMWMDSLPMQKTPDAQGETIAQLESGAAVKLLGIVGDEWAYIAFESDKARRFGYVQLDALTDVGEYKTLIIAGDKADSRLILYSWPGAKAKQLMSLKNGTACFNLFARSVGGWRKVRVGGVTGWIRELYDPGFELLSETERAAIPYYPLLMQTEKDALLMSAAGDTSAPYMTLGRDMKVEVLAEDGDYAYVRTYEGGAGAYDRGDFGYMLLNDLTLTQAGESVGVVQIDDGDLPAVVLAQPDAQAEPVGALCAGAMVRITEFTQTDYVRVALGDVSGYVLKAHVRVLTGAEGELSERIPQRATVLSDESLRAKPDAGEKETIAVEAGSRVYMLGIAGGYAYVRAADTYALDIADESLDKTGFLPLSSLNAPASTTHLTAYVNTDKVNMRDEPSSETGGIIAKARLGERLRVADYGTEWTCVVKPDGKRGYLMTKYLVFEQE